MFGELIIKAFEAGRINYSSAKILIAIYSPEWGLELFMAYELIRNA